MTVEEAKEKECCQLEGRCQADKGGLVMDERGIESLDEAIDELLSLGYLRYVEPEGCSEGYCCQDGWNEEVEE